MKIYLIRLLVLLVGASLVGSGILDASPSTLLLFLAMFVGFLGILLFPIESGGEPSILSQFVWALGSAFVFVVAAFFVNHSALYEVGLPLSFGLVLLVLLGGLVSQFINQVTGNRRSSNLLVLVFLGMVSFATIWLGPLLVLYPESEVLKTVILSISPLTLLSTLANIDYLRIMWFYQNTPFGGIRFDYPPTFFIVLFYLVTISVTLVLSKYSNSIRCYFGKL